VLVLTTPEPTAITDAYAVIKVITRHGGAGSHMMAPDGADRRVSLLVNQARSPGEARVVHERIAKVARQFLGVSVLDAGFVYADEAVPSAVRKRTPFTLTSPKCPASHCVTQLAMRLEQGVAAMESTGGFFHRMSRWFRR
jgi:flagellar biosynthesis protein FlhG